MKDYPEPLEGLAVEHDGAVLRVRLDRPQRRNALTDDMVLALIETIEAAGSDESVRVIALSGTGDDFCSGFDLGQRGNGKTTKPRAGATQRRMRWQVNRLIPTMLETQTPIVTAAKGWIIGLGLHLVLASDFAVVADDAPPARAVRDDGVHARLGRLVAPPPPRRRRARQGDDHARPRRQRRAGGRRGEWCTGPCRDADVDRVRAATLVDELASAATVAVGLSKLLIHRGLSVDLERHLADEALAIELSSRSDDFHEHARRAARSATRSSRAADERSGIGHHPIGEF